MFFFYYFSKIINPIGLYGYILEEDTSTPQIPMLEKMQPTFFIWFEPRTAPRMAKQVDLDIAIPGCCTCWQQDEWEFLLETEHRLFCGTNLLTNILIPYMPTTHNKVIMIYECFFGLYDILFVSKKKHFTIGNNVSIGKFCNKIVWLKLYRSIK